MLSSSGSSENIISLLYKKRARGSCALTPEVSISFLPPSSWDPALLVLNICYTFSVLVTTS